MKKLPIISKEEFIEVIDLLKKQYEKDYSFADFMEKYLDGRCVPMMSEYNGSAVIKLLSYIFDDRIPNESDLTWIEWFIYENDWGNKKLSAHFNNNPYIISSADDMYDFLVDWINFKK